MKIGNRDVEISQKTVLQSVNPTMHHQLLTAFPCIAGNRRVTDVGYLLDDIEFAKPVKSLGITPQTRETFAMLMSHILNMTEPIIAQTKPVASKRGLHTTAPIVSTDDDVPNL